MIEIATMQTAEKTRNVPKLILYYTVILSSLKSNEERMICKHSHGVTRNVLKFFVKFAFFQFADCKKS